MTHEARLIIQFASGSAVERQLRDDPPAALADAAIVLEPRSPEADGHLLPPVAGEIVLSVPSPEALAREPDEVRRVIERAGTGTEPLVVEIAAAEQLRDDELAAVVDAAEHARRPVILCVLAEA